MNLKKAGTPWTGLLLMADCLARNVNRQGCAPTSITRFHELLHIAAESYLSDFKQVKLVSDDASGE
ncbi:MAG: hypothetical protein DME33_15375 [Verrucomicrobia bacterium]|nr:MAG: hypothetical protein DME33_15375 [Verrucomicrobiota bacterium]